MPQQPAAVDYDKLAAEQGGQVATGVDYDKLAADHGGAASPMTFAIVNGQRVPVSDNEDNSVGTFLSHVGTQVNPVTAAQSAGNAILHPIDTAKAVLGAQGALYDKAVDAYKRGDRVEALRHFADYLIPVLGPVLDQSADAMQQGRYAAGSGDAVGLGLSLFAPQRLAGAVARLRALPANPNPAEAAAAQFGADRGIPIDAATQTGNAFVRGAQKLADESIGGSVVGGKAHATQAAALERVGGELASEARTGAVTPEQAGQGIADALTQKMQAHSAFADRAYDQFRQLAGNAPVNLARVKASLTPLYQELLRRYPIAQQQASPGLKALQNIVTGPDVGTLADAEANLSAIGAASGDDALRRSVGQGLAAQGYKELDQAIRQAAVKANPDAYRALMNGRAATRMKYQTGDVLDSLRREPVQAYRQMTAPKDSGIDLLRSITKNAPQVAPQIARAYLDDLLQMATAEGGFDRAARLWAEWQKLGTETKRILFPQAGQAQALDHFFLLAKNIAKNPNPSGSALTIWKGGELTALVTNPATGASYSLGMTGLAALLHSPTAVRLLSRGLTIPLTQEGAAAVTAANILKAAQGVGVSAVPVPALAAQGPMPASNR